MGAQKGKVYLMIKVTVPFDKVAEFNEYFGKHSLPLWEKFGAKHIGSFSNYIGDATNEIIRIFEYENFSHYEKWQKYALESQDMKPIQENLKRFIVKLERKILLSVY
jgi:hypothetical protein